MPGHHLQIAIAQETTGLPLIRSAILGFSGYQEGWGLYAEQLSGAAFTASAAGNLHLPGGRLLESRDQP